MYEPEVAHVPPTLLSFTEYNIHKFLIFIQDGFGYYKNKMIVKL